MFDYVKQGTECADRQNTGEGMKQLREAAKDCQTRADYAAFMCGIMPIDIEEADDGIILHLHKEKCTCVKPDCIKKCGADLCDVRKRTRNTHGACFSASRLR